MTVKVHDGEGTIIVGTYIKSSWAGEEWGRGQPPARTRHRLGPAVKGDPRILPLHLRGAKDQQRPQGLVAQWQKCHHVVPLLRERAWGKQASSKWPKPRLRYWKYKWLSSKWKFLFSSFGFSDLVPILQLESFRNMLSHARPAMPLLLSKM